MLFIYHVTNCPGMNFCMPSKGLTEVTAMTRIRYTQVGYNAISIVRTSPYEVHRVALYILRP